MTRRALLQASATVAASSLPVTAGLQGNQASWIAPDREEFRVLQITDLHFFAKPGPEGVALDQRTQDDLRRMVEHFQPDILAVTGDLWHDNPDGRGQEFQGQALPRIEALGLPWFFVWGNHDQLDDLALGHKSFGEARGSLYSGQTSGGNYLIEIKDRSGTTRWRFICLNSTDQGLQRAQEDWLREVGSNEANTSPALAFFHIPTLDYDQLWIRGLARGLKEEPVSKEAEDGSAFPALKRFGGIRACFCGHDHVNDYSGLVEGIELVYGRATGHAGYGADKVEKGGKLITLGLSDASYRWETVFPDGRKWTPS